MLLEQQRGGQCLQEVWTAPTGLLGKRRQHLPGAGCYMHAVVGNWYSAQISLEIKNLSDLFQVAQRAVGPCAQVAEALHKEKSKSLAFLVDEN